MMTIKVEEQHLSPSNHGLTAFFAWVGELNDTQVIEHHMGIGDIDRSQQFVSPDEY